MNLILLGPPGAGKGTQARWICETLDVPQISTGEILRKARKDQTELGKEAETYMVAGKLVPDEVVIGIVNERIVQDDCKNGYVLDGFPRTVAQAAALSESLKIRNEKIDAVISIEVPDEMIVERLCGRRVCNNCGANYHIKFSQSKKDGICDQCQGELIHRKDDSEETIKERLKVYHEQTSPLVAFYTEQKTLCPVNGAGDIDGVRNAVKKVLGK